METMFDTVGRGTDWIELKRREDERVAQAEYKRAIATAKKALDKGLSIEDAAELADLTLAEVEVLVEAV